MAGTAQAATISITDPSPVPKAFSSDGSAVVTTIPITSLAPGIFNNGLISSEYPGWTLTGGTLSPGTFSVSSYKAGFDGSVGGAQIQATYNHGSSVSTDQKLQWVQFISTNVPLGGTSTPYIDPRPNDDNLPFYWTNAELPSYTSGDSLTFYDFSKRSLSTLATTDPIEWRANLFLVEWDGATTITTHDGLQWGWDMKSATKGSASGKFVNPSPSCPPATCTGTGSSNFTWGVGTPPSSLSFAGASFNPTPQEVFSLGKLSYFNGTVLLGTEVNQVDFQIPITFDNVPEKSTTLVTSLSLINTLNIGDPVADADFVSFFSGGFQHSFHVYEGQSAQVDLLAKIVADTVIPVDKSVDPIGDIVADVNYGIELVGFGNVTGGGFIRESEVKAVPESETTFSLIAVVLAAMLGMRRCLYS